MKLVYRHIFDWIQKIPSGKVQTYGGIARQIPHCTARMVGYCLGNMEGPKNLPWHRVVNSQGRISSRGDGYSDELQRVLLEDEGVEFSDGRVNLKRFLWNIEEDHFKPGS